MRKNLKAPPVVGVPVSTAETPCPNCGLTPSKISSICGGEALLSEGELIRQLREHGWAVGNPGTLHRIWSTREVA